MRGVVGRRVMCIIFSLAGTSSSRFLSSSLLVSRPHRNPTLISFVGNRTLVGSGLAPKQSFARPTSSLIPSHIAHIRQNVKGFKPEENRILLEGGGEVGYDAVVVAAGLQISEL